MEPQDLIAGLVQRGIPVHIAQGMVANMMAESRLDPGINEIAPLVPGSRGGFGLNQWTGPRRVQFEDYAASRGADPADPNVQLDFTLWELQNTERGAWNALRDTDNATDAARVYSERFLRPGIPHMDRRLAYAEQFSGMDMPANALGHLGGSYGQNALAATTDDRMMKMNMLASLMPRRQARDPFQLEWTNV